MKKYFLFGILVALVLVLGAGQALALVDRPDGVSPQRGSLMPYDEPFVVSWVDPAAPSGTKYDIVVKDLTNNSVIGDIVRGVAGFSHEWDGRRLSIAGVPNMAVSIGGRYQIAVCREETSKCGYSREFTVAAKENIISISPSIPSPLARNVPVTIYWEDRGVVSESAHRYDISLVDVSNGNNLGTLVQGLEAPSLEWDVYTVGDNPTARFRINPGTYRIIICRAESNDICVTSTDFSVKDMPKIAVQPYYRLVLGDESFLSWKDPFASANESYDLVLIRPYVASNASWSASAGQMVASIRVATTSFSWRSGHHNSGQLYNNGQQFDPVTGDPIPSKALPEGTYTLQVCRVSDRKVCDHTKIIVQRSPISISPGVNNLAMGGNRLLVWNDLDRATPGLNRPPYEGGYNILIRKQGTNKQWAVAWDYKPVVNVNPKASGPMPIGFDWNVGLLADGGQLPAGSGYFFTVCQARQRPCAYSEKFTVKNAQSASNPLISQIERQLASIRAILSKLK